MYGLSQGVPGLNLYTRAYIRGKIREAEGIKVSLLQHACGTVTITHFENKQGDDNYKGRQVVPCGQNSTKQRSSQSSIVCCQPCRLKLLTDSCQPI